MLCDIPLLIPYEPTAFLCLVTPLIGHTAFILVFGSLLAKSCKLLFITLHATQDTIA